MENSNLDKQLKRINRMEKILGDHGDVTERFAKSLEEFKNSYKRYIELSNYYSSAEYFDDLKLEEDGKIPEDMSTAVLAEDYVYDLIGENRNILIELLKLAGLMAEQP